MVWPLGSTQTHLGNAIEEAEIAGRIVYDNLRSSLVQPVVYTLVRRKPPSQPARQDVKELVHQLVILLTVLPRRGVVVVHNHLAASAVSILAKEPRYHARPKPRWHVRTKTCQPTSDASGSNVREETDVWTGHKPRLQCRKT